MKPQERGRRGHLCSCVTSLPEPLRISTWGAQGVSTCEFHPEAILLHLETFRARRWFRWAAWACVQIRQAGALATTLSPGLVRPQRTTGTALYSAAAEMNEGRAEIWAAGIDMVLDVGVVALPLSVVGGLKMGTTRNIFHFLHVAAGLGMGSTEHGI